MVEETSLGVSRELLSATGMLGGQFGILSVLLAAPSNSMRQQHVANAMRVGSHPPVTSTHPHGAQRLDSAARRVLTE